VLYAEANLTNEAEGYSETSVIFNIAIVLFWPLYEV